MPRQGRVGGIFEWRLASGHQSEVDRIGQSAVNRLARGAFFLPAGCANVAISIGGDAIGNPQTGCRTWQTADFADGTPTSLDGVSVNIGGKPAYIYYLSPTQINVQAPTDDSQGNINVVVTTPAGPSDPITGVLQQFTPAFFLFAQSASFGYYPATKSASRAARCAPSRGA